MSKPVQCLILVSLFAATCLMPLPVAGAADGGEGDDAGKKRAALWGALLTAVPDEYRQIDVYAEDDSLSTVVFRSKGVTLMFSLQTGKVEVVSHMKALFKINRITFEQNQTGGYFALWYNGRRELTIGAGK